MPAHLFIGAGAGLVSATLFASAMVASALAGLIIYLCPLPLCLAGLGWGRSAAGFAGLIGTILSALLLGPAHALAFALCLAIPVTALVHLILLSRTSTSPDNEAKPFLDWYPAGRLVAAAALIAGTIAALMLLALGPDMAGYNASIDEMLPRIHDALGANDEVWTPKMAENLKAVLAKALPAAFAIVWLTVALFNLWLAGTIVRRSGHAIRPWPDLHALEIPNVVVLVFALALAASFLPGILGLIGTGFAGALLLAYVLQGLAVVHVYSLGVPLRPLLLTVVYIGILFLGWVAIIVAILGLGEPLFGLRNRASARPSNQDNDSNT